MSEELTPKERKSHQIITNAWRDGVMDNLDRIRDHFESFESDYFPYEFMARVAEELDAIALKSKIQRRGLDMMRQDLLKEKAH